MEPQQYTVQAYFGADAEPYLPDLAQLRIEVFKEYPYLYDGHMAYEEQYLQTFLQSDESILVIAFDEDEVVGASTGIPLAEEPVTIQQPWLDHEENLDQLYYLSESVLLPAYRGQGIGVQFFEERERWAWQLGFRYSTLCSVIRPDADPLRPPHYVQLDQFWTNRGYTKKEGYIGKMAWKEVNGSEESEKSMQFWAKRL